MNEMSTKKMSKPHPLQLFKINYKVESRRSSKFMALFWTLKSNVSQNTYFTLTRYYLDGVTFLLGAFSFTLSG